MPHGAIICPRLPNQCNRSKKMLLRESYSADQFLSLKKCETLRHYNFFLNRVTFDWNLLTKSQVNAVSVKIFKATGTRIRMPYSKSYDPQQHLSITITVKLLIPTACTIKYELLIYILIEVCIFDFYQCFLNKNLILFVFRDIKS